MRILAVDDDRDFAQSLHMLLEIRGHNATLAYSGAEAAEVLQRSIFDVVLVDWRLTDCCADTVLQEVRQHVPDAAVIIISGFCKSTLEAELEGLSITAFLTKPIEWKTLDRLLGDLDSKQTHSAQARSTDRTAP